MSPVEMVHALLAAGGPTVLAQGGDDSVGIFGILLAGPAAGVMTYLSIYRYYRNTDKRHRFETETSVQTEDFRVIDRKVGVIRKTRQRSMSDANDQDHLQRVQRIRFRAAPRQRPPDPPRPPRDPRVDIPRQDGPPAPLH